MRLWMVAKQTFYAKAKQKFKLKISACLEIRSQFKFKQKKIANINKESQ